MTWGKFAAVWCAIVAFIFVAGIPAFAIFDKAGVIAVGLALTVMALLGIVGLFVAMAVALWRME